MVIVKEKIIKIIIILISFIVVFPFLSLIITSDRLDDWIYVFSDRKTYIALGNTIGIAFIALFINIVIGTPVASLMEKEEFIGKNLLELLIFLPLIIPSFVTTMGIQYNFIKLGLIDTILGVGIIHSVITMPYYIRSLRVAYSTLSKDYEKMGKIMGASSLEIFYKINLPIIFPGFLAGMSMVLIVSFAQYLITLIIGGGEIMTIPILMFPYISGGDIKVGGVYSILYILVNLILILFLEKAVKGIYYRKGKIDDRN